MQITYDPNSESDVDRQEAIQEFLNVEKSFRIIQDRYPLRNGFGDKWFVVTLNSGKELLCIVSSLSFTGYPVSVWCVSKKRSRMGDRFSINEFTVRNSLRSATREETKRGEVALARTLAARSGMKLVKTQKRPKK